MGTFYGGVPCHRSRRAVLQEALGERVFVGLVVDLSFSQSIINDSSLLSCHNRAASVTMASFFPGSLRKYHMARVSNLNCQRSTSVSFELFSNLVVTKRGRVFH